MTEQTRRAARLLEIERLLRKRPLGWTTGELAAEFGYSQRTMQRDIGVLESELRVPLTLDGRRYSIMPGAAPLAPVRFTLQEARAIFLATRLSVKVSDDRDSDWITAVEKLAEALPERVANHLQAAADQFRARPVQRDQAEALRVITESWASSQTVVIRYRSQQAQEPRLLHLDPYFLEPSAMNYSVYVVGYSHEHGEVRTFKLDRISHAERTGRGFTARGLDETWERMAQSWDIVMGGDDYEICVEFNGAAAKRVAETTWHPTQRLSPLGGGRVRLEVRLSSLFEFVPWVLRWGDEAEVISPPELRAQVATTLRTAARRYEG